MTRTPVASSNLAAIGYDNQHQMLEIEFRNGSIYQYFNVPQRIYSDLMNAGSHGRYFDAYIKKGNYRYRRVR